MHVELDRVGKRFGRVAALQSVSLALPAGSRTALVGPNGSGKSTLTRLLTGMLAGDGAIRIDGFDAGRHRAALAPRIAYVPQIAPRLPAPVGELVAAVARLRRLDPQRVAELAAAFELDLPALRRRPFRALSGGMRQKLLAALALAADAGLLLLDEPTASMDPRSRATFFRLLEECAGGATVLLSSHRLDEIRRLVDGVVVLDEGRVAYHGAADAWLASRAEAVVEVAARGEAAAGFLLARGFRPAAGGWWSRSLPAGDRAALLRELVQNLNGTMIDLLACDVERLDPGNDGGER